MIGSLFTYNLLKLLLAVTLLICGKTISKTKNKRAIFVSAIIAIAVFSLIEGLRWDRGPDYYNNYLLLTTNDLNVKKSEPFFNTIIDTLKMLSIPYWGCFIFFSFLYIYSFTKIVKVFPKAAMWALPVMFLISVDAHENLIRQFIAISFLLFAYYCYISKQKALMLLCLLAVFNIHLSGLFAVALLFLFILLKPEKIIKSPLLLTGIYLVLYFFWDTVYLSGITSILEKINLGTDNMQGYLDNADRWFTDEGSLSYIQGAKVSTSLIKHLFTLITNSTIIYYGFQTIKYDQRLRIPYWFTFTAILLFVLGGDIEIYRRLAWWLYCFMPIILGAIWYLVPIKPKIKITLMSIIAFSYAYSFIMNLTTVPYSGYAFVWDR